jgi:signal transduction histidine kinase
MTVGTKTKGMVPSAFPMKLLGTALILTISLFIGFGWYTWNSYRQFKMIQEHDFRLQELVGRIIHLDEVLTMSARMGAVTGDMQWEERYRKFEPQLDAVLKETIGLAPEAYESRNAVQTDAANTRLVEMEKQAFSRIRRGEREAASRLLFSDEYKQQKRIYAEGIENLITTMERRVQANLDSQRSQVFSALIAIAVVLPILVLSWMGVLRTLLKYFAERKQAEVQIRRSLQRIGALREINVAMTSTLDLYTVLHVLMEKIDIFLPYAAVYVWLVDRETGAVERAACRNLDEEEWKERTLPSSPPLVTAAIENKAPVIVKNVQTDPRILDVEFFRKNGLVSYLGVPLIVKGDVLGVLVFLTREEHVFNPEEIEFLSVLADQAAIAIHNSQLHEQTRRQAVELEKANDVKNEFLGLVSHELKTPLNAVLGYTTLIKDGELGEINSEQKRALEKTISHSGHLLGTINSLLVATRVEAGGIKAESHEVSLCHFLEDLRSAYDMHLNKDVALQWDYPSDLPVVMTDSDKLRHILQNLIDNAVKFTEKGSVKVSVRCRPEAKKVKFKVTDTGVGIPEESIPLIFDMFRQVSSAPESSSGGVGVGLYIVNKFTELLGGKVDVESEPNKGSTFTITIPYQN